VEFCFGSEFEGGQVCAVQNNNPVLLMAQVYHALTTMNHTYLCLPMHVFYAFTRVFAASQDQKAQEEVDFEVGAFVLGYDSNTSEWKTCEITELTDKGYKVSTSALT
jgi:hypothetical protein